MFSLASELPFPLLSLSHLSPQVSSCSVPLLSLSLCHQTYLQPLFQKYDHPIIDISQLSNEIPNGTEIMAKFNLEPETSLSHVWVTATTTSAASMTGINFPSD